MKRMLALLLALLLAMPALALAETSKPIRIGVFEPMTGAKAAGGEMEYEGIQVAHALMPEALGRPVELVVMDNQSDDIAAAEAATMLVDDAQVDVVIGSWGSSLSISGAPLFEAAKTPAIGASCTSPDVTLGNEYYFRVCYVDDFQGVVLADYAKSALGARTAAIIYDIANVYAIGLRKYFTASFGENFLIAEAFFNTGDEDFTPQIVSVLAMKPDVVFLPSDYTEGARLIKQARELGYADTVFLGADTWETESFIELGGDALNGCLFSTFYDPSVDPTPEGDKFLAKYEEMFGGKPKGAVTALAYDAYMTAIQAIEAAGSTDGPAIREALLGLTYEGVTDHITFDAHGDAKTSRAIIKTVENGAFAYVSTVTLEE